MDSTIAVLLCGDAVETNANGNSLCAVSRPVGTSSATPLSHVESVMEAAGERNHSD